MKVLNTIVLVMALTPLCTGAVAAQGGATISIGRARAIALAQVPDNQGVKSGELKKKDGVLIYEFEIRTPGSGHREVRVDAQTGAVVGNKHEDGIIGGATSAVGHAASDVGHAVGDAADHVFGKDEYSTVHYVISEERATRIAKRTVPNGTVKDVDLERKKGILVWKVDMDTPGHGSEEVRVDAQTGAVVRVHHEH